MIEGYATFLIDLLLDGDDIRFDVYEPDIGLINPLCEGDLVFLHILECYSLKEDAYKTFLKKGDEDSRFLYDLAVMNYQSLADIVVDTFLSAAKEMES